MLLPIGDNIERRVFPVVPMLLILANVLVFAIELRIVHNPTSRRPEHDIQQFVETWGLVPANLIDGQVIGLLTHTFLHGGLLHIVGNMFFLWAFSCSLEVSMGRWTLVGFYVLFGIAGGLTHAAMDWSSERPLIGASGAIAGLIGAYTVLYGPSSKIRFLLFLWLTPVRITIPAWLFGGGWFGLQLYLSDCDPTLEGGVAWYAHIGGFLAGVVTMMICRHETECDLQRDRHGTLRLAVPEGGESPAEIDPDGEPHTSSTDITIPETCPHCGGGMDNHDRIGMNVIRCGHTACGRMVYVEVGAEASELAGAE